LKQPKPVRPVPGSVEWAQKARTRCPEITQNTSFSIGVLTLSLSLTMYVYRLVEHLPTKLIEITPLNSVVFLLTQIKIN
jgi:hypothetical protein